MKKSLMQAERFSLITFATTFNALKAEKELHAIAADFLLIPVLREISSGCGLSIMFFQEHLPEYYDRLKERQVIVEGVYLVEKLNGGLVINKVNEKN